MTYVIVSRKDNTESDPFVLAVRGVRYPEGLAMVRFLVEQGIQAYLQSISCRHEVFIEHQQELMDRFGSGEE